MTFCVFQPLSHFQKQWQTTPIVLPKTLNQAVQKRQQSFLAGRYCAYFLFQKWQIPWNGLMMLPSGAPDWPVGFKGAITHSKSLAAATMYPESDCMSMGIDAEHFLPAEQADRVKSQIIHPSETWVTTPEHLTLVFSLKESIYKALNPILKRFISFQEVCIHPPNNLPVLTYFLQKQQPGEGFWIDFEPVGKLANDFPDGHAKRGFIRVIAGPEPQLFSTYGTFIENTVYNKRTRS